MLELKDGDTFDTKKAAAEHRAMENFIAKNAKHLPYVVQAHFCCFNQNDKEAILAGFKHKISLQEAMTGREFCALLALDYDQLLKSRQQHASGNLHYFLSELVKIDGVQGFLSKHFG